MIALLIVGVGLFVSFWAARVHFFLVDEINLQVQHNLRMGPYRRHRLLSVASVVAFVLAGPWLLIDITVYFAAAQFKLWRNAR